MINFSKNWISSFFVTLLVRSGLSIATASCVCRGGAMLRLILALLAFILGRSLGLLCGWILVGGGWIRLMLGVGGVAGQRAVEEFDQNVLFVLTYFFYIHRLLPLRHRRIPHKSNSSKYYNFVKLIFLSVCIQKSNRSIHLFFMILLRFRWAA